MRIVTGTEGFTAAWSFVAMFKNLTKSVSHSLPYLEIQGALEGQQFFQAIQNVKMAHELQSSLLVHQKIYFLVKECTLLQCFAYGCVGFCRVSYFDSVRDYLLSGI